MRSSCCEDGVPRVSAVIVAEDQRSGGLDALVVVGLAG